MGSHEMRGYEREHEEMRRANEELRARLADARADLGKCIVEKTAQARDLAEARAMLETGGNLAGTLTRERDELRATVAALRSELAEVERGCDELRALLNDE